LRRGYWHDGTLFGLSPSFDGRRAGNGLGRFWGIAQVRIPRTELRARRKPRLLLRLAGTFLSRLAERQLAAVLSQLPPRLTRLTPERGPDDYALLNSPFPFHATGGGAKFVC